MAITIDLPQQMAEEAKGYATLHGTTLEQMFLQLLKPPRSPFRPFSRQLSCSPIHGRVPPHFP